MVEEIHTERQNTKDFGLIPIPKRLRYDPQRPFHFGIALQVLFGLATTFIVANLFYCQPILIELAESFEVSYSRIAEYDSTIFFGFYAIGLLLISPLGDLVRRRQLILTSIILSCSLTIGLAVTTKVEVFIALTCIIGFTSVVSPIFITLAADLSLPEKRAYAISIVFAGLLLGVLIARVLSGIIAQYATWRVIYYFAIAVQAAVLVGIYLLLPDYPAKNKHLTYWEILFSMAKYLVTEPVLVQAVLINLASYAVLSSFWTTLTFLLGGDPYNYSTLVIGLFGLVGMCGVAMGPVIGRAIDNLIPWYATLIGSIGVVVFASVQLIGGGIHVSAVIISIIGIDVFRQLVSTSLSVRIFSIAPEARSRLNAVNVVGLFSGQVLGSSVGSKVFLGHGWRAGAGLQFGFAACALFVLLLRGPHCQRHTWFGYEGGLEFRKGVVETRGREGGDSTSMQGNQDENVNRLMEKDLEAQAIVSCTTRGKEAE
ncbi:MFS general substrate transporter [Marasmius fiardii PR-910]|nr:MFS general substrate transporter [Marasmius fiardii PR-910]